MIPRNGWMVGSLGITLTLGILAGLELGRRSSEPLTRDVRLLSGRVQELADATKSLRHECRSRPPMPVARSPIVAEQGGATLPAASAPVTQSDAAPEPEDPVEATSEDAVVAMTEAQRLIDDARTAGAWRDSQASAFRAVLHRITGASKLEILSELAKAINDGELKVETDGPPF